jgi:hypothetical protein
MDTGNVFEGGLHGWAGMGHMAVEQNRMKF